MRQFWMILVAGFVVSAVPGYATDHADRNDNRLSEVAVNSRQWTGLAVSGSGRIFVNFPRWSADVPVSVGELTGNGGIDPFPNSVLNVWKTGDDPREAFVCVQSVYVDREDHLWILDPANPLFGGVVEGGAKLMRVDLKKNEIEAVFGFDAEIAPPASYLNDVRIDTQTETAYITDSGLGAIVVLDIKTGIARRLLDNLPDRQSNATTSQVRRRRLPRW